MSTKIKVGIFFGGQSREREISFRGGKTAFEHIDKSIFEPIPIFVDSLGNFIQLKPELLYEDSLKDFYPSKNLNNGHRVYIESLGELNDTQLYKLIYKIGKEIKPEKLKAAMDFAFVVMHGPYAEDGSIQGLLEWFGIPYMGPGLLGSAIGIDKSFQNKLINVATNQKKKSLTISKKEWDLANKSDLFSALINEIGFPFVVKSPHQGSSIGVAIVKKRSTEEFSKAMSQCFFETTISQKDWSKLTRRQKKNLMDKMLNLSEGIGFPVVLDRETIYHPTTLIKTLDNYLSTSEEAILSSYNSEDFVLIEEFIDGREFSIGIIQDDDLKAYALPPTEIYGNTEAFDFKSKYQTNTTKKRIPVDTNFTNLEKIESSALTAFEFTGMSVVCRIDGFLTPANEIILHDPNTLPGMSPTSLIFKQLIEIGISITQGITYLIRQSCIQRKRSGKHTHKYAALVERIDALMQASNAKEKKKVAIIFGENADDYSKAQLAFNQFAASEEYNGTCICAARNGNYYQIPINKMFKGDILEFGQSIGAPTHEFVQKLVTKTEKIRNFYAGEVDFKVKKIEKDHIQNDFDLLYSSQKENFIESI
ncbi:D-alanine-D-alanine ligase [Spirosomataceae bacterium TFI 002]|nr:D-alanine-D-alanine ligase [Spirosomataceae bacterium TFI 002]